MTVRDAARAARRAICGRGLRCLYAEYAACLDEERFEDWPEFFPEDCLYKIVPRENFERGLPLGDMALREQGYLKDRVVAIRKTLLFAPRRVRHLTSNIRLRAIGPEGLRLTANFALCQTMVDQPSELFLCGKYHDRVIEAAGSLRFAERICVYNSTIVPTSLVYPV